MVAQSIRGSTAAAKTARPTTTVATQSPSAPSVAQMSQARRMEAAGSTREGEGEGASALEVLGGVGGGVGAGG